jgi:hypothetical protein
MSGGRGALQMTECDATRRRRHGKTSGAKWRRQKGANQRKGMTDLGLLLLAELEDLAAADAAEGDHTWEARSGGSRDGGQRRKGAQACNYVGRS